MTRVALLLTLTVCGCQLGPRRAVRLVEKTVTITAPAQGLLPANARWSRVSVRAAGHGIAPHDTAGLCRVAADALEGSLPGGATDSASPALGLDVRIARLQCYERPLADGRRQRSVVMELTLLARLGPQRHQTAASTRIDRETDADGRALDVWSLPLAQTLARRLGARLGKALVGRPRVSTLTLISDRSAPIERAIDQLRKGDTDAAELSFGLAARNAIQDTDVARYDLGQLYEATGRVREARAEYARAWLAVPDPRYLAALKRLRARAEAADDY